MLWFEDALRLFSEVPHEGGKMVSAKEFFLALKHCANIFRIIWGAGLLASTLEADMVKVCQSLCVSFSCDNRKAFMNVCL